MFISMDSKKHAFPEPFISQRRKVICGFGLGVGASVIIFTVFLFNRPVNVSRVHIFLQGFQGVRANSSFASFSFSFSPNLTSSSVGDHTGTSELQKPVNSGISRTRLENASEYGGNKNLQVEEQSIQWKRHEDGALGAKRSDFSDSNGQGIGSAKIGGENSSKLVKDASLHGEGKRVIANANLSDEAKMVTQKNVEGKPPRNANFSTKNAARSNNATGNYGGHSVEKNKNNVTVFYDGSQKKEEIDFKNCDLYDGKWVRDDSKPYYPSESCPYIDRDFDCHSNGRPDSEYVKWRWQPNGCLIPSLNATDFLERLRGRKLVFVGDSLNRNMWESLVCLLRQSIKHKKRVYEISGNSEFKKSGFYAFRFEDYNCSVDYVSSPFLVRESTFTGKNGTFETLRLDKMDPTTRMYYDADIIIFNTGHWWTHDKTSRGEYYYQEGNYVHPRLKVLKAFTRALTTWARWIDKNIDSKRTQVLFRGFSPVHFSGGQWNSGGQCHKEREPIFNDTYLENYPSKMRALEYVIKTMKTPVLYMNISRLTDYRKDAHPSIYRMPYRTEAERNAAIMGSQDCSHWCLPGVPDTWNELLYVSLLKYGKGTWKT